MVIQAMRSEETMSVAPKERVERKLKTRLAECHPAEFRG